MLAGLLSWPQATFASELTVDGERSRVEVAREVDGGLETLSLPLPAVVTADLRLNEPRYASLPAVTKAKKAAVPSKTASDLGATDVARLFGGQTSVDGVTAPPARPAGRRVGSVEELEEEAKVL